MTYGKGERYFPGLTAVALAAALSAAACSNTTMEDVPVAEGPCKEDGRGGTRAAGVQLAG